MKREGHRAFDVAGLTRGQAAKATASHCVFCVAEEPETQFSDRHRSEEHAEAGSDVVCCVSFLDISTEHKTNQRYHHIKFSPIFKYTTGQKNPSQIPMTHIQGKR